MRLFKTYSHISTLRGYEASGRMLTQKTSNGEQKTGNGPQKTPANGGVDRRASYHFPQSTEGGVTKGDRKGKRELSKRKQKNSCKKAGVVGGIVETLASKAPSGRKSVSERALRTKPNPRVEWTSYFTLRGRRRNRAEKYREYPPMKTALKTQTKRIAPEEPKY